MVIVAVGVTFTSIMILASLSLAKLKIVQRVLLPIPKMLDLGDPST